jgi:phage-related protein
MARDITVRILGDARDASKAFDELERKASSFGDKLGAFGKKMATVGAGLTAGITLPLAGVFKAGFAEFAEGEKVAAQTGAALKSTGADAWTTADAIGGLANKLSELSSVDDEVIQASENMLLTFANVQNRAGAGNDIFDQATLSALDMSVALGEDATASAMRLGKALNDPVEGVSALRRVGVQLTDDQEKQIKKFTELGDVTSAQKVILGELNKEFGKSAEAFGNTNAGKLEKFKNRFAEISASLVTGLMPALDTLSKWLGKAMSWFEKLTPEQQKWAGIIALCAAALGPVVTLIGGLVTAIAVLLSPVTLIVLAIGALVAAFVYFYKTNEGFRAWVDGFVASVVEKFGQVVAWFQQTWPKISEAIGHVVAVIVWLWDRFGNEIIATATFVWNLVYNAISNALTIIQNVFELVLNVLNGDWSAAWENIKAIVLAAWDYVQGIVGAGLQWILSMVSGIGATIGAVWSNIWSGITGAVGNAISGVVGFVTGLPGQIRDAVAGAFDSLWEGFRNAINRIVDAFNGLHIPSFHVHITMPSVIPNIDFNTPDIPFPDLPHLAKGGTSIFDGLALLGEQGRELVKLPKGASVIPNRSTEAFLNGRGQPAVTNSYTVNVTTMDARGVKEVVIDALASLERRDGRLPLRSVT